MAYHAIVSGGTIPVYSRSNCASSSLCGELYNGEVFIDLGITTGYLNVHEVRFLNPSGTVAGGFIDKGGYGNLMYSGTQTSVLGFNAYAFKLRRNLPLVNNAGTYIRTLSAGTTIYTNSAAAGYSNKNNFEIVGYDRSGVPTSYSGFVTLDYSSGSMFASNFCLRKK